MLITGPKGVGKATLAYRFARFILSGGMDKNKSDNLFGDSEINFDMNPENPVFSRIISKSHPDLMVLETNKDEDKNEITVDDVREINNFIRMTSGDSGWKVVIIDSVDEMNTNAANAILKILEEPPEKSVLLLISTHRAGYSQPYALGA